MFSSVVMWQERFDEPERSLQEDQGLMQWDIVAHILGTGRTGGL